VGGRSLPGDSGKQGMPSRPETWSERYNAIRQILEAEVIRKQSDLINKLENRGFRVTQSSISRDLQELNAVKVDGRYILGETLARDAAKDLAHVAVFIREVRTAGANLLVVTTLPGRASAVADAVDNARWPELVGTLAGDNTIFFATNDRREQSLVEARLSELIKGYAHE